MLKAVVDLGSRAARLLIADVNRSSVKVYISRGFLTMLGSDDSTSIKRLNQALKAFAFIIERMKINSHDVIAFGTAVFRVHPELSTQVRYYFPSFQIISGLKEAHYSFAAGILSQESIKENQRVLVIDQGGGSLELCLGYRFEDLLVIENAMSLTGFGSLNYHEDRRRFVEELILNYPTAQELDKRRPKGLQYIVGMGSVVTQLAFLQSAKPEYRLEEVNGFVIKKEELQKRVRKEQSLGVFLDVLNYYYLDQMLVSGWGTRHGALFAERILLRKDNY